MNDYARGAFEALSWILYLIEDLEGSENGWQKLKREVEERLRDIQTGVAVHFKTRLESLSQY